MLCILFNLWALTLHPALLATNSSYVLLPLPVSSVSKTHSLLSCPSSLLQQLPVCFVATTPNLLSSYISLFSLLLKRPVFFCCCYISRFALLLLLWVCSFTTTPCFLCCYNSLFALMIQSPVLYVGKNFCLFCCYKSHVGLLQLLDQTNLSPKCALKTQRSQNIKQNVTRNIPQDRISTWEYGIDF